MRSGHGRKAVREEGQAFLVRTRSILYAIDDAEEQMAARRQQPAGDVTFRGPSRLVPRSSVGCTMDEDVSRPPTPAPAPA